jgi:hypothetical protein
MGKSSDESTLRSKTRTNAAECTGYYREKLQFFFGGGRLVNVSEVSGVLSRVRHLLKWEEDAFIKSCL